MLEGQRLKNIKEELEQDKILEISKEIIFHLEKAIKEGFKGTYWGFYIHPKVGEYLTSQGIRWKTYSDGIEFEESKVWID